MAAFILATPERHSIREWGKEKPGVLLITFSGHVWAGMRGSDS